MKNNKQTPRELQERQGTSLALSTSANSLKAKSGKTGLSSQGNSEVRSRVGGPRLNVSTQNHHFIFVLSKAGKVLAPTKPAKARKLLKANLAKPIWSRFNTFGIQLLTDTRQETPDASLGIDNGTKFEGYSVIVGTENLLNVKLDLPDKATIVRKLEKRKILRRARRFRNCRRRPVRSNNRSRKGFIAPSQLVIVNSRLKIIRELFRLYPINVVGFEDVKFNYAKNRWGTNFSTVEIGKTRIKEFLILQGAKIVEYQGYETKELREKYGYKKTSVKNADKFTAHCSDSLTLAVDVLLGQAIKLGQFLVVDDTYRAVRRQLHDTQPIEGVVRKKYSWGTIFGLRKGLLIGTNKGKIGQLCGEDRGNYRYYNSNSKRQAVKKLAFACGHFVVKEKA